jgi:hypothetical protein
MKYAEYAKDLVAIFSGALLVLATQLENGGFVGIAWAPVVAASIGSVIAWSRIGVGGFRKDPEA